MKLLIFSFKRYKTIIYTLIFNKCNKTNRNNIYFSPNENSLHNLLEKIKSFGDLSEYKYLKKFLLIFQS